MPEPSTQDRAPRFARVAEIRQAVSARRYPPESDPAVLGVVAARMMTDVGGAGATMTQRRCAMMTEEPDACGCDTERTAATGRMMWLLLALAAAGAIVAAAIG